jgi:RNA polymerase sigma-70 factor, ECF subfamily
MIGATPVRLRARMAVDVPCTEPLPAEATVELLHKARLGDSDALNRILERCIPALRRWARGRMPRPARGMIETADLVQDAVMAAMRRLDAFEPRHQGALQAYLRKAVLNRIRDVARRQKRTPQFSSLSDRIVDERTSPLEAAIGREDLARYEAALQRLSASDREAVVARLELQQTYEQLAIVLNKPSGEAARMAVTRAIKRLADEMSHAAGRGIGKQSADAVDS